MEKAEVIKAKKTFPRFKVFFSRDEKEEIRQIIEAINNCHDNARKSEFKQELSEKLRRFSNSSYRKFINSLAYRKDGQKLTR